MQRKLMTTSAICAFAIAGMAYAQTTQESGGTSGSSMTNVSCSSSLAISDTDNDGTVSQSEFENWNNSGFEQLDEDGDGRLSRSEYVDCITDMPGEQTANATGSSDEMMQADTDADGAVSAREYMTATNEAQQQAESGEGDAILLLRRFILVPASVPDRDVGLMSRSEVASSSSQRFRSMDENMDGKISANELNGDSEAVTEKWANADFDDMDSDNDGMVTMSEYSEFTEERWGSASENARNEAQNASGDGSGQTPDVYYFYFHNTAPRL